MKPENTKQEILLFTNTSFARREFSSTKEATEHLSPNDKLEKACWDGLLGEMLPEVVELDSKAKFISEILTDSNFLLINLGSHENEFPCFSSLDPNFFVPAIFLN